MMRTSSHYHVTRRMWITKSSSWDLNNTFHSLCIKARCHSGYNAYIRLSRFGLQVYLREIFFGSPRCEQMAEECRGGRFLTQWFTSYFVVLYDLLDYLINGAECLHKLWNIIILLEEHARWGARKLLVVTDSPPYVPSRFPPPWVPGSPMRAAFVEDRAVGSSKACGLGIIQLYERMRKA